MWQVEYTFPTQDLNLHPLLGLLTLLNCVSNKENFDPSSNVILSLKLDIFKTGVSLLPRPNVSLSCTLSAKWCATKRPSKPQNVKSNQHPSGKVDWKCYLGKGQFEWDYSFLRKCETSNTTIYHNKSMPVCKTEESRQCTQIWKTLPNGDKVNEILS